MNKEIPKHLQESCNRAAELYATGNHRASFADTFDERAFLAGCEFMWTKVCRSRDALQFYKDYFDGKRPYLDKGEHARLALKDLE